MKRILLGGLAGGVTLFLWASVSHMVLPLGEVGVKQIPNEAAVLEVMTANMSEPGFYIFPGEQPEQGRDYSSGPRGVLVYSPRGGQVVTAANLLTELLSNILAAVVAAFLLAQTATHLSFGLRVLFVALLGLFVGLDVHVSYWNWYTFPTSYTLAVITDGLVGWALAGAVLAKILKPA